jgi:DNA (cytosine-5)-methyltransferase 1
VCAYLVKHFGGVFGIPLTGPTGTVTAKDHHSLATVTLGDPGEGARRVAAFMTKFYGTSTASSLAAPSPSVTAQGQHLGLVTVTIEGAEHVIVDVGMRMLTPRELSRAMGFADSYKLVGTDTEQIARVGNAVPPPLARAVVAANFPQQKKRKAA